MVRHFLGSDPCAKPAPNAYHAYVAEMRTTAGLKSGRVYRHTVDELTAEISRHDRTCYVILVDRGKYSHEERFVNPEQAVDRWFELFKQEETGPELAWH
jgi:hypothetical protein